MRHFRDDVLKADEISKWLRIPKSTIYKLCLEGQIPGTKIGQPSKPLKILWDLIPMTMF
jgi:excisionase family DNA binding protein